MRITETLTETKANVETIKRAFADFQSGNIEGLLNSLTDDITWSDAGYPDIPYAGKRTGRTQVGEYFTEFNKTFEVTLFEPTTFVSEGNKVAVQGHAVSKNRETGKTVDADWAMFFTMVDGRTKTYQAYFDTNAIVKSLK